MSPSPSINKEDYLKITNLGMERAALACIINYPETIAEFLFGLQERDFSRHEYRVLFSLIKQMAIDGAPIDTVTIVNEAQNNGLLEDLGGASELSKSLGKMVNAPIIPEQSKYAINELKKVSFKRASFIAAAEIQEKMLESGTETISDLIAFQEGKLTGIAVNEAELGLRKLADSGKDSVATRKIAPIENIGIPSGFPFLDRRLSGFRRKSLTVVAARAKTGKSSLLMRWAVDISVNQRIPVLFISTEMGSEEDMFRALSMLSGVGCRDIERGTCYSDRKAGAQVDAAYQMLAGAPLFHEYMPDFTFDKIMSLTRLFLLKHVGYDRVGEKEVVRDCVVFFDYIKIIDQVEAGGKEYQQLGHLTSSLKNTLAGRLDIPVVTAAQLNRTAVEKRNDGNGKPERISDEDMEITVSGSDRILHYCNNLLILRRRRAAEMEGKDISKIGNAKLIVAATRSGGEFKEGIPLYFDPETVTFSELSVGGGC